MLMELVEAHIISGNWPENKIVDADSLMAVSGVSLDTSMFPEIKLKSTGQSSHRLFRQILSTNGRTRRLCFIDTVLRPPSIYTLVPKMDEDDPSPSFMSSAEPPMGNAPKTLSTSDLTRDTDAISGHHYQDINKSTSEWASQTDVVHLTALQKGPNQSTFSIVRTLC